MDLVFTVLHVAIIISVSGESNFERNVTSKGDKIWNGKFMLLPESFVSLFAEAVAWRRSIKKLMEY